MRKLFKLLVWAALIYAGWWVWKNYDIPTWYRQVKTAVKSTDTRGVLILPKKFGEKDESQRIFIKDCEFSPAQLTIDKGVKVVWYNQDSVDRQIISSGFDSSVINPGKSFVRSFNKVGTFDYFCADDTASNGQIIVE